MSYGEQNVTPSKQQKHAESALMRRTRELLRTTAKTQLDIFGDTGISPNWLTLFGTGRILNPSVNRVEALYNYLRGAPLEVE